MNIQDPHRKEQLRNDLIAEARRCIGKPYLWGGNGPDAYDCSGLVKKVAFNALGIHLPRRSQEEWTNGPGQRIEHDRLFWGDLVFFSPNDEHNHEATHVGIYIGEGMMINAQVHGGVQEANIHEFGLKILGGRRLIYE